MDTEVEQQCACSPLVMPPPSALAMDLLRVKNEPLAEQAADIVRCEKLPKCHGARSKAIIVKDPEAEPSRD